MRMNLPWMMVVLAMVCGHCLAAEPVLDGTTRKEAEATLARGAAWLQAQQCSNGRIGSNEHVAVTALALRAVKAANARNPSTLDTTEKFLNAFLATNPTNPGFAAFNAEVCRKVLRLPDPPGQAKPQDCGIAEGSYLLVSMAYYRTRLLTGREVD